MNADREGAIDGLWGLCLEFDPSSYPPGWCIEPCHAPFRQNDFIATAPLPEWWP